MKTNVRPGDRAIIVKAKYPENHMLVVEVIRQLEPGLHSLPGHVNRTSVLPSDGVVWEVESLGRAVAVYRRDGVFSEFAQAVACADSQLRRLPRPDEMDDATPAQDSRPVPAEVA